jgi:hypothetical protein
MEKINFENAYYLKLGKEGSWEDELQIGNKARISWLKVDLIDIQNKHWDKIKKDIENDFKERNKEKGATQDFNALKSFCEATENDIFITFFNSKLYWCVLDNSKIQQDDISKYRSTKIKWNCKNINDKLLNINQISGKISKTQGFRATLCKIDEKETLKRIINDEISPIANEIIKNKENLSKSILKAITELHWKDCEILTDLIFRQSGWRRISLNGENMKSIDLELIDPITKELFQVQVKASAGKKDFLEYAEKFNNKGIHKLFFVTYNPDKSLFNYKNNYDNVQIIIGLELAELIMDLGLTNWVLDKTI